MKTEELEKEAKLFDREGSASFTFSAAVTGRMLC